ncbi:MAG: hypothetical protein HY040_28530 [Planctomycetes bacterium]|nr:hypothetical protein [Planctomycetota bacterium]
MSAMTTMPRRHALGLPAGSVRATHLLIVVALICATLLIPNQQAEAIPAYLVYLFLLMLGHYFAHRSHAQTSAEESHPLYLPRGCIRFLIMAALVGAVGWRLYDNPEQLKKQFDATVEGLGGDARLPLLVVGGFFFGVLVRAIVGREAPPYALQDMEAWLSLISTLGLAVAAIIHLVIDPSLDTRLSLPTWEGVLAAIVSFYFGERS